MKKLTALKTTKTEVPVRHPSKSSTGVPTVFESGSLPAIERNILSTLNEMERWMEESFARPFSGFRLMPFRHMFQDLGAKGDIAPSVDVFEEGNDVVVKAELPGMKRDDVDVRLSDNMLTISGEKKSEASVERKDFIRLERAYGSFSRTVRLPEGVRAEGVKAHFVDGVLEVRIPRDEDKSQVRHIDIE